MQETKTCKHCNVSFFIKNKDMDYYSQISPKFNGIKYQIPTPTFCPDCRQQRRLAYRNERSLYKGKCDISGDDFISIYSPDKPYIIYKQNLWLEDESIPMKYGREFDESKIFFEQFNDLLLSVPRLALHVLGNENCEYVNQCGYSKSCYLCYNADYSENCTYCKNVIRSKECIDCLNTDNCENCYSCVDINSCYEVFFAQKCRDSSNLIYCYNLINCKNCFGCVNLVNKNYCIYNIEYSKDDYERKIKEILEQFHLKHQSYLKKFEELKLSLPKVLNINSSEDITGDNILNSKNVKHSFDCFSVENIAYCTNVSNGKNIYDFDIGGYESEMNFEMVGAGDKNYNCLFCTNVWGNSSNLFYSDLIIGSKNLFGCIGLRNKEYCIFNKQYTRVEYEHLVPKIIKHMEKTGEWGEFFPGSISPFGYNETVAQEFFPLTKEKALKQGFKWSSYESPFPEVKKIITASAIPENIKDIPDDILNWAVECEITKKPFKILKRELEFYRKYIYQYLKNIQMKYI